ncbi:MAG: hypothetical protein H7A23_04185 [Leptospiraceae bacterium]|nr:hypothetical protein [Leptospiraceae bacterium]MCP5493731.1 hypothetical protein [Leptospiraceae bacterium]
MSNVAFDESLEEDIDVGSFNHASVQVNLAYFYFELGIQPCWLVDLSNKIINVYSSITKNRLFDEQDKEVIDENIGIRLPIAEVFE